MSQGLEEERGTQALWEELFLHSSRREHEAAAGAHTSWLRGTAGARSNSCNKPSASLGFVRSYSRPTPRAVSPPCACRPQEAHPRPSLTLFVSGSWPAEACHLLYSNPEPTLSWMRFRFPEYNICCALCCQFTVLSIM